MFKLSFPNKFYTLLYRQLHFVEYKQRPKRVQISHDICTPEDRLGKFSRNAQAMNWIKVTKKKIGLLDNKSLTRGFVGQYRWELLLVVFILTSLTGSSKYGTTRKNIQRYYTTI